MGGERDLQRRAVTILGEALALPAAQQAAHLDRACAGDERLRREVEALLGHSRADDGFLADPSMERAVLALGEAVDDRTVGPYRVLRKIGAGGMGVVLEVQHQDSGQRVAMKLLNPSLGTPSIRERFRHETEVLRSLRHPNIAAIHDRGDGHTTFGELPYYTMELIEGVPITEYVAEHGCTVAQVVRLLLPVLDALDHAHRHGVIHRDLKPGNLLVTADGVPKVIDFGIATTQDRQGRLTLPGHAPGTSRYMSPEQRDPRAATGVDARSDLYALGMVLRRLLGDDPVPPALAPALATATAEDPADRYPSARAMRADLERFLEDRPVRARGPAVLRRITRALRRHPARAALGAALLAAVALAATWRSHTRSLLSDINLLAPGGVEQLRQRVEKLGNDRQLLQDLATLAGRVADQPDTYAAVIEMEGDIHFRLGETEEAWALRREVVRVRRSLVQARPEDDAGWAALSIAIVKLGDLSKAARRMDEAEQRYQEALEIDEALYRQSPTVHHLDNLFWSHHRLAWQEAMVRRRVDAALPYALRALDLAGGLLDRTPERGHSQLAMASIHELLLQVLRQVGPVPPSLGRYHADQMLHAAEAAYATEPDRRVFANGYTGALQVHAYQCDEHQEESEGSYQRALALARQHAASDPDCQWSLRHVRACLAWMAEQYRQQGDLTQAREYLEEALRVAQQVFRTHGNSVALTKAHADLAAHHWRAGAREEFERHCQLAVQGVEDFLAMGDGDAQEMVRLADFLAVYRPDDPDARRRARELYEQVWEADGQLGGASRDRFLALLETDDAGALAATVRQQDEHAASADGFLQDYRRQVRDIAWSHGLPLPPD